MTARFTLWFCLAGLVHSTGTTSPEIPQDPVGDYDFPDPAAMYHDGVYYAFGGCWTMHSKDLSVWSSKRKYLASSPAWSHPGSVGGAPGAPIQLDNGKWMMTFQAEERHCTRRVCTCIGAAFADHPSKPFTPAPNHLTCMASLDGAIDSSPRRLPQSDGGGIVIYFKTTGHNTLQQPSQLWVARMNDDGPAFARDPVKLLDQTAAWEMQHGIGCIEAPALLQYGNKTLLFYSGGDWTAGLSGLPYSVGYADCQSAFGPCRKMTSSKPWFGPAYNDTVGTGGQEFFLDSNGQPWIVFHGWKTGHAGYSSGGRRAAAFYPMSAMPKLSLESDVIV